MREQEKPYQYWLMRIKGLGKKRKTILLQNFGSAQEIYHASEEAWEALLGEKAAEKMGQAKKHWNILAEYEKLCGQKIKFTCYGDEDYPKRLSEIPDAPFGLYYQGRLPSDEKPAAALIGARACSGYGMYAAREFGSKLASAGIQIISGLAMGIDGISQEAALAAGGESFGVLGCGVDICYPKSNRNLYEQCRQRGGILSEYPPGTAPAARLFPPRNRIISGLSDIVVVVEAREKSGTLITVDMALEQGREVFAIPGRITDPLSRGCNALFGQGAGVAVTPADILEVLKEKGYTIYIEETEMHPVACSLSGREKQVYECLTALPETAEVIYEKTGKSLPVKELLSILVELCLKGFAKKEAGGYSKKVLAS